MYDWRWGLGITVMVVVAIALVVSVLTARNRYGWDVIGIRQGYDGLLSDETQTVTLTDMDVRGLLAQVGFLGAFLVLIGLLWPRRNGRR